MNLSALRPEGQGLPFDKLKPLSKAEGLKVHPEPRFITPSLKTGLRAVERVRERLRNLLPADNFPAIAW